MKKHTAKSLALALLVLLLHSSLAFAACILPTPAQQMAFVPLVTEVIQPNPGGTPPSYGLVTLANVPPGYSVTNGIYIGWCMNPVIGLTPATEYNPIMYDTYDLAGLNSIGVPTAGNVWNKVNYIINHKPVGANASTIQAAIWRFINFSAADEASLIAGTYGFGFPPADLATINAIQADADANGASFVPMPPQVTAIYLDLPIPPQTIPRQPFIIEVLCSDSGSIGDTVFCDFNRDGVQQAGEPGLQGVKVTLTGGSSPQTAFTDANGKYVFNGLAPGNYTVAVDQTTAPAGCDIIIPNCPLTKAVSLALGQTFQDADFCFGTSGAIGDTVFCDFNRDGVQQAGEPGLQNVKVTLTGGSSPETAFTDVNGKYLFTGLPPGNYTVTVDQTTAPLGCNIVIPNCPLTRTVSLALGQTDLTADFCFGTNGAIGDTVFCDFNRDGVQQAGEPGLQFVKVTLTGGSSPQTAFTDVNGKYLFTGLPPGNYTVTVDQTTAPLGCNIVIPNCPLTRTVSLALGQTDLTADFCFGTSGAIGDTVFCDFNRDGVQQVGEPGLQNVKVTLTGNSITVMAFTDVNGKYLFDGLPPGNYTVTVDQTTAPLGCNIVIPNCPLTRTVSLTLGQSDLTADFCFGTSGAIGDTVFCDFNRDGVQQAGEPGLQNVKVTLTGGSSPQTAFTDVNGKYLFDGLPPGNYTVTVDQTTAPLGCNIVIPNCPLIRAVSLALGQTDLTADFCFGTNGKIGDTVFCDENRNGVQDAGDVGLQGVKVTLTGGSLPQTAFTDASGKYLFADLPPGSYTVTVDQTTAPPTCNVVIPNCPLTRTVSLALGQTDLTADFCFGRLDCVLTTFNLNGNTALSGPLGNSVTFMSNGVFVKATAFSRTKDTGIWAPGYVGAYSGGLGVTDSSEGDGSNNTHTVDNLDRQNYILFEFSQPVVLNRAYLGFVVDDSDLSLWIGTFPDPFNNHLNLNDTVLGSFGFTESNETTETTARWADLNAGEIVGNAIVIAAWTPDTTPEDQFKIQMLDVCVPATQNLGSIGDTVFCDYNENGIQETGEPGIANAQVNLVCGSLSLSTLTDASGNYLFAGLPAGTCTVSVNTATLPPACNKILTICPTSRSVTLSVGQSFLGADFCFGRPPVQICIPTTFTFSGNTKTSGTAGNIRNFVTPLGVSVKVSAFSRVKSSSAWSTAYVGSYSNGLGVTDSSEGDGSADTHTVDNIGRDNYLLFEFSEPVVVDSAFLGYVVTDSDMSVWIGTFNNPFTNHLTLSNSVLSSFGFSETNLASSSATRLADLNVGAVVGNALVIAASVVDTNSDDRFKLNMLNVCKPVTATGALPSPWSTKDIGNVVAAGSAGYSGGKFTIIGSGDDIWNAADAFRYVYQSASGNCSIVAKITGVSATNPWSKAGVMIREALNADSKHASVFVTPANGVAFQYRNATGGTSGTVNTTGLVAPYWVKLVRSGNTFTASRSANGSTWTTMGSQTITMGASIYIGLPVTSHEAGTLCGAVIESVTATP